MVFPRDSARLALPGALMATQVSLGPGCLWDSEDGAMRARFGAVPLLWDALC